MPINANEDNITMFITEGSIFVSMNSNMKVGEWIDTEAIGSKVEGLFMGVLQMREKDQFLPEDRLEDKPR